MAGSATPGISSGASAGGCGADWGPRLEADDDNAMAGPAATSVSSGTSDRGCGADSGACLDVNGDTGSGAEASAAGAPDGAPTTLPAVAPPSEDGAGASEADAPDDDMMAVTDAEPPPTAPPAKRPGRYSVVDAEYLRRRRRIKDAQRNVRQRRNRKSRR